MIIFNKYKITNMKRFKRFIFVSVLLTSLLAFTLMFTLTVYSNDKPEYTYVRVTSGDSLWSIASSYNNKMDIRKMIYLIEEENNINRTDIQPGDVLKIPLY